MTIVDDPKAQATEVIRRLKAEYPDAGIVLDFGNPWELLVAVILSAQCTDKKVNEVTAKLFKKYRTVEDYAAPTSPSSKRRSGPPASTTTRQSTS